MDAAKVNPVLDESRNRFISLVMNLEKLTLKSQEALSAAQQLARERSHQEIDGEHLALALIEQTDGLIPDLLARIGAPAARLKPDLEAELARRHRVSVRTISRIVSGKSASK